MADAFGNYIETMKQRTAQMEQQTQGSMDVFAGRIGGLVKDRWWKKEYEEFKETAGAEFNEALSKIGQLTSDETFNDIPGIWGIFSGAVKSYMEKVGEYPTNPYIGQMGKGMFEYMQSTFSNLTQGVQTRQEMQIAGAGEERAAAAQPLLEERYRAETDLRKAQAEKARRGPAAGIRGALTFGKADLFARTPVNMHLDTIKRSKPYKDMIKEKLQSRAAEEWNEMDFDAKYNYNQQFKKYLESHPGLTFEEEREVQRDALGLHLSQFYAGTRGPYEINAVINEMLGTKEPEIRSKLEDAKQIRMPTGVPVHEGSNASMAMTFQTDEDLTGKDYFDDPPDLAELQEKYKGSPAERLASSYIILRKNGIEHQRAVKDLFRSRDQGGSGEVDLMTTDVFSGLGKGDTITDKSIENWRRDLIKLLQHYKDEYEGMEHEEVLKGVAAEKERLGLEAFTEEGIEGVFGAGMTGALLGAGEMSYRAGRSIKRLIEEGGEVFGLPGGERALAEEGLRTKGRILPPKKRPLPILKGIP